VWVTGAVSHPVFDPSGISTDRRGFARIRPTLQFEEHDNLFGTGDCATLIDHPGTAKAGVYAVRQGPVITDNLRAALAGEPLRAYTPQTDLTGSTGGSWRGFPDHDEAVS
jgi:NADH dehydrogenase FAD-containing subunit